MLLITLIKTFYKLLQNFFYKIQLFVIKLYYVSSYYFNFIFYFGLFCIIDVLLIDDEPLWEPLEWSLTQSWLFFIFLFSWLVETLISSHYGSFTGRDKRVYNGLFKAYWYVEFLFMFTLFITAIFIWTPFYFELTYKVSNIMSWWSWYNRFFFYKVVIIWFLIDIIMCSLLISLKWLNWKKIFLLLILICLYLFYLFYYQFIIVFFGYFTDILSFKNNYTTFFNKLQEGPYKFGWGDEKRDLFNYKKTSLNVWYKNDSQYALSLFFINIFVFISLSLLIIQVLLIIIKLYSTQDVSFTSLNFLNSSLNIFFIFFMFHIFFIGLVFIYQSLRYCNDFLWFPYIWNFIIIILESLR